MKGQKWLLILGIFLVGLSLGLALLHGVVFNDLKTLAFYLGEDLVFLPVDVLLVTLIVQGLLTTRERRARLQKMNMVIEVFYSEIGTELMKLSFNFLRDSDIKEDRERFIGLGQWESQIFRRYQKELKNRDYKIDCHQGDLERLRSFLLSKRDFSLRLLENPNLLEHETFTDLLWAVFHLTEELASRTSCQQLAEPDRQHLANDIKRAYLLLLYEWLGYMQHLKNNYPYLFSLAARLNPFDPQARAELK